MYWGRWNLQSSSNIAFPTNISIPLFAFVLLGLPLLIKINKPIGILSLFLLIFNVLFSLTYQIPDIEPFYLTNWLIIALWIGIGFNYATLFLEKRCRPLILRSFVLIILLCSIINPLFRQYLNCTLENVCLAYDFGMDVLNTVEQNSEIRTKGWTAPFVLLSLIAIEKRRPDVIVNTPLLDLDFRLLERDHPVYYVSAPDRRLAFNTVLRPAGICLKETKLNIISLK